MPQQLPLLAPKDVRDVPPHLKPCHSVSSHHHYRQCSPGSAASWKHTCLPACLAYTLLSWLQIFPKCGFCSGCLTAAGALDRAASSLRGYWRTEDWGYCSKTCGNGTKTRDIVCEMAGAFAVLAPVSCIDSLKPNATRSCNTQACGLAACPAACTQDMRDNDDCDPECNVPECVGMDSRLEAQNAHELQGYH